MIYRFVVPFLNSEFIWKFLFLQNYYAKLVVNLFFLVCKIEKESFSWAKTKNTPELIQIQCVHLGTPYFQSPKEEKHLKNFKQVCFKLFNLIWIHFLALADYETQLATLPVRQCDSLAYKHRKENLEREIYELDEAIKTFSKRKVYVQQ